MDLIADPREVSNRSKWEVAPLRDSYSIVLPTDDEALTGKSERDKAPTRKFLPRKIDHPGFQNVDRTTAETILHNKPIGEVVIRPSSRGYRFLTITWKCCDDVYVHVSVEERDKPNDVKMALGRTLVIDKESYDDLDEILERYVS